MKWLLLLCLAAGGALAQPEADLPAFAGSRANYERLVQGLRGGLPIELTSIAPDGVREAVAFQAARALSEDEALGVLRAARDALRAHGVQAPGAWEIGIALMGGTLQTPGGKAQLPRLVAPADPQRPIVIHLHTFAGSKANYRSLTRGLTLGTAITLRGAGGPIRFQAPGGLLSEPEAKEALQAAGELLAGKGINDPAPAQLRDALVKVLEARAKEKP